MNINKYRYELKLNDFENHCIEVLRDVYKIKPSEFLRQALIEKIKKDIPEIRKKYLIECGNIAPF